MRVEVANHTARKAHKVYQLLRSGLVDRIALLHCSLDKMRPDRIDVGLIYDTAHATRVLDIGPSSESTEQGKAFRELWGEKAELRRFKDGSIAESVSMEYHPT